MKLIRFLGQLILTILPLAFLATSIRAQVSCIPVFPVQNGDVTIYFHADEGNGALNNFTQQVYAHMGVITNQSSSLSDWKLVPTTWGIADPKGLMVNEGPNLWSKTININSFFNVPGGVTVLKLAFVFRNQSGSIVGRAVDGSDIYYDVYPDDGMLRSKFIKPGVASFLTTAGELIDIEGATSKTADIKLFDNGTEIGNAAGLSITSSLNAGTGFHLIEMISTDGLDADTISFSYLTPAVLTPADPPAGTNLGINYIDGNTVRLMLQAPGKNSVFVTGSFNNWQPGPAHQMRKSLNGQYWWIELTGLTPGEIYTFQYLIDGGLKIADPLSTLVLDPWNDSSIPAVTFPNLPAYPAGKTTGIVSVLQTAQPAFNWQATNYNRPEKSEMVVYELLLRDFMARHDYQTLLDTLDYLQNLGVNSIELMPVSEFDGNLSWGYNPAFHNALDKYYGDPSAFKSFVDACHQRNIAVILDVVFNQASGSSPLAQLYWDAANNRPATNNPWLNPVATHPFNVFNDFNHESTATKDYVKTCLKYWMEEYRIDGYRFDLSKGFTQFNSGSNVGLWSNYDASRVAIWKDYADFIWALDPGFYVILEHFAANNEEKVLAEYGMMLWGNMQHAYKEVALGFPGGINTSLTGIDYKSRTWAVPHLVGYMESHDEERIGYECKTYGYQGGNYNVRLLPTTTRRIEMLENLFYTVPGPKMLWEFGELGYDYSINYCENGTINPDCRTASKPIRWDYFVEPNRRRLYDVTRSLLHLRNTLDAFHTTNYTLNLGGGQLRTIQLDGQNTDVVVAANAGVVQTTTYVSFPSNGTWYEYYTGTTIDVTGNGSMLLTIPPGGYQLYTSTFVALPDGVVISAAAEPIGAVEQLNIAPNPSGNQFGIWMSLKENVQLSVKISDISGRIIFQQQGMDVQEGDQFFAIDGESWSPGLYLLMIQDNSGAIITKKLLKQ